jgi:hypothetical protein
MVTLRRLGYHGANQREIYLLTLDALSMPLTLPEIEGRRFACLCLLDAKGVSTEVLGTFCSRLLHAGCAYLCTWGPDCERVHDIMDEQIVGDNPPHSYAGAVLTTWPAEEPLERAIWYFLYCTDPDKDYAPNGCDTGLIITVAESDWNAQIEKYVSAELA